MVFGKTSLAILEQCDPRLQRIARRALRYQIYDFSVIAGYRSSAEQMALFNSGRTQIDGYSKKSKHNYSPALAMDLCPWPPFVNGLNVWEDHQRFAVLAGTMALFVWGRWRYDMVAVTGLLAGLLVGVGRRRAP